MLQRRLSTVTLGYFLVAFLAFCWLFPTLRYALVGTQAAHSFFETFITALPDILLVLLLAYGALAARHVIRAGHAFEWTLADKAMLVFWLSNVVLGAVLSMNVKYIALGFRITYLPMLFYALGRIFSLNQSRAAREQLLFRIFIVFSVFALAGLLLYFVWPSLAKNMAEEQGYEQAQYFIPRMTSILWTPVLFGTMMALAALFFAFRLLRKTGITDVLLFSLCWICLFLSVSRGPILGFLIGLLAMIVFSRAWKNGGLLLALAVALSSLLSLALHGDLQLLKWIFKSTADTVVLEQGVTRVNRWEETWKDFRARPWGYGLGRAGQTAYRYLPDRHEPGAPWSTDGWLLKTACETGIWGVLSYLALCVVLFFRQAKTLLHENRSLVLAAAGMLLMTNAQALVSNVYDFYPLIGTYWLIIGLAEPSTKNSEA